MKGVEAIRPDEALSLHAAPGVSGLRGADRVSKRDEYEIEKESIREVPRKTGSIKIRGGKRKPENRNT